MLLTTGLSLPPGQCYKRVAWGPDGHIAAACDRMVHFLDARTGEVVDRVEDAHDAPVRLRVCPWAVCACGQSVAWAGRDCGSVAVLGARCCAGLRGQGRRDAHALCHAAAFLACFRNSRWQPLLLLPCPAGRSPAWSGRAASCAARRAWPACWRQAGWMGGCGSGQRRRSWCEAAAGRRGTARSPSST